MSTLICVPVMVLDEHTALADAVAARDLGADLVEFRIDEFFTGSMDAQGRLDEREVRTILRLIARCPLPCIVTCRAAHESGGGHGYAGDEGARIALFERLGAAGARTSTSGEPAEHPPRYIDVEYSSFVRSPAQKQRVSQAVDHGRQQRDLRTGLILSMHDFSGRPRDLLRRVMLMQSEPAASIIKIAVTARSLRDNLELFDLLVEGAGGGCEGGRPMIALAMGPFGLMSRVLAPKFGGFLTFASLRDSSATAPGQPTVRELTDVYRFQTITARTRVYGVVGWPLEHSLSPLVHNAGFEAFESDTWAIDELEGPADGAGNAAGGRSAGTFDAVYLPLPIPPEWEHFKATMLALIDSPRLDFCGCSVTAPHKQHLVRLAREAREKGIGSADGVEWLIDDLSEVCGAANTLVVERDRAGLPVRARVLNTDANAAAACLRGALGELAGRRVLILGAGGAARAVAAGLLAADANVLIWSRSAAKAAEMVADLERSRGRFAPAGTLATTGLPWEAEGAGGTGEAGGAGAAFDRVHAVVNCTPVGMMGGPEPGRSPIDGERLRDLFIPGVEPVVFDTVYRPLKTPLLEQAARSGMRTLDGLGMFVKQAAEQFATWTGRPAPARLFERVCREALQQEATV